MALFLAARNPLNILYGKQNLGLRNAKMPLNIFKTSFCNKGYQDKEQRLSHRQTYEYVLQRPSYDKIENYFKVGENNQNLRKSTERGNCFLQSSWECAFHFQFSRAFVVHCFAGDVCNCNSANYRLTSKEQ